MLSFENISIKTLEHTWGILEKLAENYDEDSDENKAIVLAASAMGYIFMKNTEIAFMKFLTDCGKPITDLQMENMRHLGMSEKEIRDTIKDIHEEKSEENGPVVDTNEKP